MPTSQVRVCHVFVLTADRRTDLVGRPFLHVHPTISMTPGRNIQVLSCHGGGMPSLSAFWYEVGAFFLEPFALLRVGESVAATFSTDVACCPFRTRRCYIFASALGFCKLSYGSVVRRVRCDLPFLCLGCLPFSNPLVVPGLASFSLDLSLFILAALTRRQPPRFFMVRAL
jgi:hypothetical protein